MSTFSIQNSPEMIEVLACPESGQPLTLQDAVDAADRLGVLTSRVADSSDPVGATRDVLVRDDGRCAYPIVEGIPVLLVPEMLTSPQDQRTFDLSDPKYAEAYEEMSFYNAVATEQASSVAESDMHHKAIRPILEARDADRQTFPNPRHLWLDATYDSAAQWDAYQHIAPVAGKRVLQLGGMGLHAVKFLLAGAKEAWVVTPMIGEVHHSIQMAKAAGVLDGLRCVVAVAEELPFLPETFDVVYSGGCVHHMTTTLAFPEIARVLKKGGKFGAIDPWRAPFYAIGTKILGKREPEVFCRPLTKERVAPMDDAFTQSRAIQHGTLTRYPLLALNKFGLSSSLGFAWSLTKMDDAVCSIVPGMRGFGSSVALVAEK